MTALFAVTLLICLPAAKGKARLALVERGTNETASWSGHIQRLASGSRGRSLTRSTSARPSGLEPTGASSSLLAPMAGALDPVSMSTGEREASSSPEPHPLRFLARHTNAVLSHKCLATHSSRPRSWLQARTWHRQAHRAKRGTCKPATPWPSWWYGQAMCIHRHEAVNWHETSNPSSRGGMQIQYATWASVGGHGDPAYASPYEQLYRAYLIWRRDGGSWREWTTAGMCGL